MPICNLLIKTLGAANGQMLKFILQLDSPSLLSISSFQIVPSNQFSFDFVGNATVDHFNFLTDPNNGVFLTGFAPNSRQQLLVGLLNLPVDPNISDTAGSLVVGMQGTGTIADNTQGTEDMLFWKVVSISGQPPPSWPSMDIFFQDLPAPSDDSAVV